MFKFKDGKPDEVISARNIKYCESKSCKTKIAITQMERALYSVANAPRVLLYVSSLRSQQMTFLFEQEGIVTLPNSNVTTNDAGSSLNFKVSLKSGFNINADENW